MVVVVAVYADAKLDLCNRSTRAAPGVLWDTEAEIMGGLDLALLPILSVI